MHRFSYCIIFVLLIAAGCAGPRGTLGAMDHPGAADPNPVEPVLVATTRTKSEDPAEYFTRDRSAQVNFAQIGVLIPPSHQPGRIEVTSGNPIPEQHFAVSGRQHLDGGAQFVSLVNDALERRGPGEQEVVVFVHGFNQTFAEGLYRTAQIRHDFDLPAVAVHYSWPSAGEATLYAYDRDSASFARGGLVEVLDLLTRSKAAKILIVAHSMGSMVTMEALLQARLANKSQLFSKLAVVALASPDIDVDVFRQQMEGLGSARPRMVVLVSNDDRALRLSQRLRGGHPRIGQGENIEELIAMGIAAFDLSALSDADTLSHSKFAASPSFIEMIRKRQVTRDTIRSANATNERATVSAGSLIGNARQLIVHLPRQVLISR